MKIFLNVIGILIIIGAVLTLSSDNGLAMSLAGVATGAMFLAVAKIIELLDRLREKAERIEKLVGAMPVSAGPVPGLPARATGGGSVGRATEE